MKIASKFSPDVYTATYKVEQEHHGLRIDVYIKSFLKSASREQIQAKIVKGDVQIQDRPGNLRASTKVLEGDLVHLQTYAKDHNHTWWKGAPIPLRSFPEIIYEEESFLVVNKPPFMTTHPTGPHLFYTVTTYLESKFKEIHTVHRLDQETSGALILAKTVKGSQSISSQFLERKVKKAYFVIAHNLKNSKSLEPFTAKERFDLGDKTETRVFIKTLPFDSKKGKSAQTQFVPVLHKKDLSLLLAYPKTGRQHQIRVHAHYHNFPLVGDKNYYGGEQVFQRYKDRISTPADDKKMQIPRQALHAWSIRFHHPNDQKLVTFVAPVPQDLENFVCQNFQISQTKLDSLLSKSLNFLWNSKSS